MTRPTDTLVITAVPPTVPEDMVRSCAGAAALPAREFGPSEARASSAAGVVDWPLTTAGHLAHPGRCLLPLCNF